MPDRPIEGAMEHVYTEVRAALDLVLDAELAELPVIRRVRILHSLDDAVSNNWDTLVEQFWRGMRGEPLPAYTKDRLEAVIERIANG